MKISELLLSNLSSWLIKNLTTCQMRGRYAPKKGNKTKIASPQLTGVGYFDHLQWTVSVTKLKRKKNPKLPNPVQGARCADRDRFEGWSKIQMIVISTRSKLNVLYYKYWLCSFEKNRTETGPPPKKIQNPVNSIIFINNEINKLTVWRSAQAKAIRSVGVASRRHK